MVVVRRNIVQQIACLKKEARREGSLRPGFRVSGRTLARPCEPRRTAQRSGNRLFPKKKPPSEARGFRVRYDGYRSVLLSPSLKSEALLNGLLAEQKGAGARRDTNYEILMALPPNALLRGASSHIGSAGRLVKGTKRKGPQGSLPLVWTDRGSLQHALESGRFDIDVGAADGWQH
jgi:hypothetical protein